MLTFLFIVSVALVVCQVFLILRKREQIQRLEKINKAVYDEYQRIRGPEFADKHMKKLIRKVVRSVDHGTNTIHRAITGNEAKQV